MRGTETTNRQGDVRADRQQVISTAWHEHADSGPSLQTRRGHVDEVLSREGMARVSSAELADAFLEVDA